MRRILLLIGLAACRGEPAARDAMPVAPDAPSPRAPAHGAFAPAGRPPAFRWDPAPGAPATGVRYQVQLDDRCAGTPLDRCDPVAPPIDVQVGALSWQPATLAAGRWAWRVRACLATTCSPWSRMRRVDVGRAPSDVDGDGHSDVIAGAPLLDLPRTGSEGHDRGAALLVFGGAGTGKGKKAHARTARLDEPGGHDDAELGAAVAIVGDVDGDGLADVVVGAPGTDKGRGRAYLYLGTKGGVRGPVVSITDPAGRPGDWLGATIAGAGDVDGDGFADVAIAAPGADGDGPEEVDRGKVLLWRGGPAGLEGTAATLSAGAPRPHDGFGAALSAGDLDGDGYGDLVVGAAGIDRAGADVGVDRGAVYVFPGGRDGIARSPAVRLEAPSPVDHDRFGYAVSASGDLDGDDLADLAVGVPSRDDAAEDAGVVYIYPGRRAGVARAPRETIVGGEVTAYRRLGTAVAIVGDVDGDGRDDLCAGTSGIGGGIAVILSGADLLGAPLAVLRDATAGPTDFGDSVAGAGDVDGDGFADVVVGAASSSATGAAAAGGSVLVFRAITASAPPVRIDGPGEPAQLGRAVAGR